eukprot:TRINITY_DN1394_c0_g2_i1.p1 TRINITY_DN1394_c0_g2~~TRINITY_DN1394_c0_g2_i1.p1  ORF type:complete len:366 (+),score=120.14 TRINITY_DN1394_c0_g2_i1:116-1213(+)
MDCAPPIPPQPPPPGGPAPRPGRGLHAPRAPPPAAEHPADEQGPPPPAEGLITRSAKAAEQLGDLVRVSSIEGRRQREARREAAAKSARSWQEEQARRELLARLLIAEQRQAEWAVRDEGRRAADEERLQREIGEGREEWQAHRQSLLQLKRQKAETAGERGYVRLVDRLSAADESREARERQHARERLRWAREEEEAERKRQRDLARRRAVREAQDKGVRRGLAEEAIQGRLDVSAEERATREDLAEALLGGMEQAREDEQRRLKAEAEEALLAEVRLEQLRQQQSEEQEKEERRRQREQQRIAKRCTHGRGGGSLLSNTAGARKGCRFCGLKLNPANSCIEHYDFESNKFTGQPLRRVKAGGK